jgi:hypothetical protein
MAEQLIEADKSSPARPALTCRLRQKTQGRAAQSPTAGEVELENTSADVLEIELQMSPFQHLNLVVTDAAGRVVSEGHYGDRFSPLEEPYVFRLQPGEKYTGSVSLLGTVPEQKRLPGTYTVRAVYEYKRLIAVSEPFHVQLEGEPSLSPNPSSSAG